MTALPQYAPQDALEAMAWRDCLMWAVGERGIRDAFEADTGLRVGTSLIDRMIDQAAGFDKKIAEAFISWFNENVWGNP